MTLNHIGPTMNCLDDPGKLVFNRQIEYYAGQGLHIRFDPCLNDPSCKSEAEIDRWLAQKLLVIYYNGMAYQQDEYANKEHIKAKSSFEFQSIYPN